MNLQTTMSDDECDYMSDDFLAKLTQVDEY